MSNAMPMWQVWIRPRGAACSHTETVYIQAKDQPQAWERAELLFSEGNVVKACLAPADWVEQTACGCSESITWVNSR